MPVVIETAADVELVGRAAAGDADAFEELLRDRMPAIYRFCVGVLSNEADAADVTQDALVAAWRELPRLRDPGSFDPWLRRIAFNTCRMLMRHRRSLREIRLHESTALGRSGPDPGSLVGVALAFDSLPLDKRAILTLHHLEGRSLDEIAGILDVPVGTVKSRLHAARQALAAAMRTQEPRT